MANERQNEYLSWRAKLGMPDAVPEQGLDDREQSWQRLAERLQKRPRRHAAWMLAAACVILAFFPVTHLFRGRPAHPIIVANRPTPVTRPVVRSGPTGIRQDVARPTGTRIAVTGIALAKPRVGGEITPAVAILTVTDPTVTAPEVAAPTVAIPAVAAPTAIHPEVALPASSPLLLAKAPPHRQLRVVCYNEIGNPAPPPMSLASRGSEPFRITLGRLPELGSGDPTLEEKDFSTLIIKLIPQNH